ncbi:hypothetical protein TB2_013712 [Malus domestica]
MVTYSRTHPKGNISRAGYMHLYSRVQGSSALTSETPHSNSATELAIKANPICNEHVHKPLQLQPHGLVYLVIGTTVVKEDECVAIWLTIPCESQPRQNVLDQLLNAPVLFQVVNAPHKVLVSIECQSKQQNLNYIEVLLFRLTFNGYKHFMGSIDYLKEHGSVQELVQNVLPRLRLARYGGPYDHTFIFSDHGVVPITR